MALIEELRAHVPDHLVPSLVREIPGAPGKTPVESVIGIEKL
ncbi:MAG: hypothetical protein ABI451_10170 [Dokdonella sp.]